MSNLDKKWTEEWFELTCKDTLNRSMLDNQNEQKKAEGIVVKFFTKLWTNCEDNSIEGESCLQVLNKSSQLLYEMKDSFKTENILNKEDKLKNKIVQVKKIVPIIQKTYSEQELIPTLKKSDSSLQQLADDLPNGPKEVNQQVEAEPFDIVPYKYQPKEASKETSKKQIISQPTDTYQTSVTLNPKDNIMNEISSPNFDLFMGTNVSTIKEQPKILSMIQQDAPVQ